MPKPVSVAAPLAGHVLAGSFASDAERDDSDNETSQPVTRSANVRRVSRIPPNSLEMPWMFSLYRHFLPRSLGRPGRGGRAFSSWRPGPPGAIINLMDFRALCRER